MGFRQISMRGFPAFQSGVKSDSLSMAVQVPFAQTLTINILVRKASAQGHEIRTKGEATERSVSLVPQVVHSHGTPTETSWISDVMKRHLTKCQLKSRTRPVAEAGVATNSLTPPEEQPIIANTDNMETSHQGTLNEISSLPTKKYSLRSGGSHQHSIEEDDTEETETSGPCLLPDSSLAELRWSDRQFEDIQLLLDPILFDKVEHNHALQLPSAVGVPCIDIDPADTFSFLARISSKESASLQTRYDCSSLLKRGWEGQGVSGDSIEKQGVLPFPVPASSLTDTWPNDLNLFSIKHKDLDNVRGGDFCWETFIATEECIRTMLFIYIHDTGFAIFTLCAEAFQINSLISVDTQLQPMRTAIHNWKLAWNQRFAIQDSFGLPKEEDNMFVGIEDYWRRLGFFQNASEYWLLLNILIRRIDERQQNQHDLSVQSDVGRTSSVIDRPYTPSRCDSPTMEDLNNLISEHHRQFKPYA
ncbi:hypothetical protein BDV30DRAFT_231168 [Aspergillus minisclerotigenes]|uniref:Uncharacterized protein n=1 Tax=Aspergillus minisclerotigenes TaxID=656917 RepID=A0A5N6IPW2_9EURO|nr:hypothetical protein BDV30DRAFT_231168 [Aspergillus minisclerotigenes]